MSGSSDPDRAAERQAGDRAVPPNAIPVDAPREKESFPTRGRLLGLDFGTRRIGIAVSDEGQRFASPLDNYTRARSRPELDALHIGKLAREYEVRGLVVGLPLHMGGEEGQKAGEARRFGAWAAENTRLPVVFWDERLTSALAEEHLLAAQLTRKKRKLRLDMVAAQIMLQSYLDSRASGTAAQAT